MRKQIGIKFNEDTIQRLVLLNPENRSRFIEGLVIRELDRLNVRLEDRERLIWEGDVEDMPFEL